MFHSYSELPERDQEGLKRIFHVVLQKKSEQVQEALDLFRSLSNSGSGEDFSNVAMADSLDESWKDLKSQLETRRILLDTSVAFHHSADEVR